MRQPAWALLVGLAFGLAPGSGEAGSAEAGSTVLQGIIRDEAGGSLPGVRVQVFLDGFPLTSARSDTAGSYRVAFPWNAAADSTLVVWWTEEDRGLLPAQTVLRESTTARRLGLWDATIPRAVVPAESVWNVVLRPRGSAELRAAAPDSAEAGSDSVGPPAR